MKKIGLCYISSNKHPRHLFKNGILRKHLFQGEHFFKICKIIRTEHWNLACKLNKTVRVKVDGHGYHSIHHNGHGDLDGKIKETNNKSKRRTPYTFLYTGSVFNRGRGLFEARCFSLKNWLVFMVL